MHFDEEKFFNFAAGVGLKGYQRFLYGNFSHRLMNSLPRRERLTKDDVAQSIAQISRYYTSIGYQVEESHSAKALDPLRKRAVNLANEVHLRQMQLNTIE